MIIDIHAHYLPRLIYERFDAEHKAFPGVTLKREDKAFRMQFPGGELTRPISPNLSDLDHRRAWMDKNGIDHQLVGGWLDSFGYELPAQEGLAWSRFINTCMQESLKAETRFTPLATVPLQDGNLRRTALECARDLKAGVFLHPMFLCGEPRLSDYDLVNAIGRVADTSIAVARLLHSGHLLKYSGVKLVISHGGAALPYVLGRLARNFTIAQGKYADPRKGFEALYFDSVVFDRDAFEFLAGKAGPGKIMLGSDMPFPIGDLEPQKLVHAAHMDEAERQAVLEGTAKKVFRVRPDCWCKA